MQNITTSRYLQGRVNIEEGIKALADHTCCNHLFLSLISSNSFIALIHLYFVLYICEP